MTVGPPHEKSGSFSLVVLGLRFGLGQVLFSHLELFFTGVGRGRMGGVRKRMGYFSGLGLMGCFGIF